MPVSQRMWDPILCHSWNWHLNIFNKLYQWTCIQPDACQCWLSQQKYCKFLVIITTTTIEDICLALWSGLDILCGKRLANSVLWNVFIHLTPTLLPPTHSYTTLHSHPGCSKTENQSPWIFWGYIGIKVNVHTYVFVSMLMVNKQGLFHTAASFCQWNV